jgi:hypothetical protein
MIAARVQSVGGQDLEQGVVHIHHHLTVDHPHSALEH